MGQAAELLGVSPDELGLAPGVLAVASAKATNVVVELPAQRGPDRTGRE